ncbi:MAG: hypothetical protein M3Q55_13430 [Acidobacteriota bacterium]|nr:hypothetical protein [Acidobacteriota bacterium]
MAEFQVRSDAVDVEHIMRQIRQRITEKRGVDYTEEELKALAGVKLEKFLDPTGVRSDLVQQFRQAHPFEQESLAPTYAFEDTTLYETHRGILRAIRRLLRPILKLFINPDPIVTALHIQSELNDRNTRFRTETAARQHALDQLRYEVMHNLVLELTRTSIEVRNLKMRLDAIAGRLDFDERRQRAFEGVVEYKRPVQSGSGRSSSSAGSVGSVPATSAGAAGAPAAEGEEGAQRSRKRRRRRRRVPSSGIPGNAGADSSGGSSGSAGSHDPGGDDGGPDDGGGGEASSQ